MNIDPRLTQIAANQPHPLLFATVSGAHLYGFPSPDSDYDLRGVHILPLKEVVGLNEKQETIQVSEIRDGLELDLVTHDIAKFFGLLLQRNGYVLEQLYSPLVAHSTSEHEELKTIARGCITRHHAHHYLGFSKTQWKLFEKETPHRVKSQVLDPGAHLRERAGEGRGDEGGGVSFQGGEAQARAEVSEALLRAPRRVPVVQQRLQRLLHVLRQRRAVRVGTWEHYAMQRQR